MGCSPRHGSVCGPQYDRRPWFGKNGSGSDVVYYNVNKLVQGQIIAASDFTNLGNIIREETNRRNPSNWHNPSTTPKNIILSDQYNILAQDLNNLNPQCIKGSSPTIPVDGFLGNGSETQPYVQKNPPAAPTKLAPTVFGNNQVGNGGQVIFSNPFAGDVNNGAVGGFNDLIDSLIFAGQQCFCNCNFCACNCNFCTCNCNFRCTCNCNYSDERVKENIQYL